jgi:hypothetical protein
MGREFRRGGKEEGWDPFQQAIQSYERLNEFANDHDTMVVNLQHIIGDCQSAIAMRPNRPIQYFLLAEAFLRAAAISPHQQAQKQLIARATAAFWQAKYARSGCISWPLFFSGGYTPSENKINSRVREWVFDAVADHFLARTATLDDPSGKILWDKLVELHRLYLERAMNPFEAARLWRYMQGIPTSPDLT